MAEETLKKQYSKLSETRQDILDRGIDCAELTIPSLLTEETHTESDVLPTPFQSLGSRAVNNLASKLLMSLLPPNAPFFKFVADKKEFDITQKQDPKLAEEIKTTLISYENNITESVEKQGIRINAFYMFKLLIATGNALVYKIPEKGIKVFDLSQYVVQRSADGKVLKIITKEKTNLTNLPEEVQTKLKGENDDIFKEYDIYTGIILNEEGKYDIFQEVEQELVPGTEITKTAEDLPWLPLRWTAVNNEAYGRGLVEQYIGDLRSLEGLTQAIVEGAAASSKVLFMVNPLGTTKASAISKAKNGDIIQGNANEVTTLQVQKGADMNIAYQTSNDIMRRLSSAFLLNESARREAERVTATEITYMASELEDALGGIYSILALEFQQPLVKLLMKESKIKLDTNLVKPIIVSGLDALSRTHDFQKLTTFSQTLQNILGPEIFAQYANVDTFIQRVADALNIDSEGLVKTAEKIQEEQQQAMLQQADNAALQSAAAQGGSIAGQQIAQEL